MKKLKEKIFNFFYRYKYGTVMFLLGIIILFWDMLSKSLTDGKNITLIDGVISFFSSHNTGAAWSILNQHTWLLILVSIVFIGVILVANWFFKHKNYFYAFSLGLILSGAICNLIDRLAFGYVRDFISLDFINFPIFNIADCAITIGVIMLCIHLIFFTTKKEEKVIAPPSNIETINDEAQQNLQTEMSENYEIIANKEKGTINKDDMSDNYENVENNEKDTIDQIENQMNIESIENQYKIKEKSAFKSSKNSKSGNKSKTKASKKGQQNGKNNS